jgi:hypothetical protein
VRGKRSIDHGKRWRDHDIRRAETGLARRGGGFGYPDVRVVGVALALAAAGLKDHPEQSGLTGWQENRSAISWNFLDV